MMFSMLVALQWKSVGFCIGRPVAKAASLKNKLKCQVEVVGTSDYVVS